MGLGIGFVGCGFIATIHAGALTALAQRGHVDVNLAACCDRDPRRAGAFAATFGFGAHTTDPAALVARDDVDAVYVCTPTASHPELVELVAAHGKALFCEKPLAFDAATAERMAATVAAAAVVARVGLVLRFSPTMREVRRRAAGSAGIMATVLRDDQFIPIRGRYGSTWRADRTQAGAGTVLEHSIHDFDILRWICGDVASVAAVTRCVAGHPGIEDTAVVTLEFAGGAVGSLVSVWHDVDSRASTRRLEVLCRDTWVATDDDTYGDVTVQGSAATEEVAAPDSALRVCEELGAPPVLAEPGGVWMLEDWAFCRTAAGASVEGPTFDDAVAAHRCVDAVYESARRGGAPVDIPRARAH